MAITKVEALEVLTELSDRRAALDLRIAAEARAARTVGATWNEIGRTLGMTRQAAQQRFGAVERPDNGGNDISTATDFLEVQGPGRDLP